MRAYYSNNRAEFLETTTESQIHNVHLEVCGDGCASGLGQVDHVFSVGLGLGSGLLGIPDGLHLGDVGAVLEIYIKHEILNILLAITKTTSSSVALLACHLLFPHQIPTRRAPHLAV